MKPIFVGRVFNVGRSAWAMNVPMVGDVVEVRGEKWLLAKQVQHEWPDTSNTALLTQPRPLNTAIITISNDDHDDAV